MENLRDYISQHMMIMLQLNDYLAVYVQDRNQIQWNKGASLFRFARLYTVNYINAHDS